ncbi:MAG TPA: alcohol dehydrogenase catalytic domain-containing protein [Verrucomicrobiae bacterium]|nr:alcohol dehydrogenase catalytic domain-containing protein [Verrucomicrobiae bacterium]
MTEPGRGARTMRAAVFAGAGRVAIESRPAPSLASAQDVLVAVEACGLCGTDLHILEDPPGHPATPGVILGHEIVGRVTAAGPEASGVSPGDRVAVAPNLPCGTCSACKWGHLSHCERLSSLGIFRDGGLAELVSAPARACHRVSERVATGPAALIEPLSCVLNGVDQGAPRAGEVAVIFGAGAIGLLFLAVLRAGGVRCVVVEPLAARRQAARQMGAVAVVDPSLQEVGPILAGWAPAGADLAVDAVGTRVVEALAHTRARGRVVVFGMNSRARAEIAQNDLTRRELRILGTYVGDLGFPPAVRLLESGLLDLSPLVSHLWPLERLDDALVALRTGAAVKVVLTPGPPGGG